MNHSAKSLQNLINLQTRYGTPVFICIGTIGTQINKTGEDITVALQNSAEYAGKWTVQDNATQSRMQTKKTHYI